jgi:DNA-binding PadR family transcriptional regulator
MKTRTPRELLTPAALHVLLSLSGGERHGYGIKLEVEERTAGALSLGPGTLYEAIHRMEKAGWIESPARKSPRTKIDPRRRYYRLTKEGRDRLKQELERLREIVSYARARDLIRDPESA